jgi:hypothetical protein
MNESRVPLWSLWLTFLLEPIGSSGLGLQTAIQRHQRANRIEGTQDRILVKSYHRNQGYKFKPANRE